MRVDKGGASLTAGLMPVSVIIPCYNSGDTIVRAVDSVLSQSSRPSELILVDDASDDEGHTLACLYALQKNAQAVIPSVEVVSLLSNGGPAYARNAGWDRASCDYIAFLDADDIWHPDKLRLQGDWMMRHPEVAMSGHRSQVFVDNQDLPVFRNEIRAMLVTRRKILLRNCFSTRTIMIRRDMPLRFEPEIRRSEDYDLWLRVVLGGAQAWRLELPLAYSFKADYGAGGLSAALWKMEKAELDTYLRLYHAGEYSLIVLLGLDGWSLIRFLRRLASCLYVMLKINPARR
jgi:glycosyltransferase involved in cell wall biosynthesis